jgi:tetratricopeptide (TPR) repeat protein
VQRKTNLKLLIPMFIGILAMMFATQGCGVINKLRAKDKLNQGVREFNKGKYDIAQQYFGQALDLSPEMTNAQLFYARALNAQFDQNLTEKLGVDTVKAYDSILQNAAHDAKAMDTALALQANVYKQLSQISDEKAEEYKRNQHEKLIKRAELPSATTQAKADVYYTLGVDMWKTAYDMGYGYVSKKQPIPPDVQNKMKPVIQKAHEFLQKTLSVDPNYANAYFYDKLVYIEDTKVTSDPAKIKEFVQKQEDSQKKYMEIQAQQRSQAAANPAGAAPAQ